MKQIKTILIMLLIANLAMVGAYFLLSPDWRMAGKASNVADWGEEANQDLEREAVVEVVGIESEDVSEEDLVIEEVSEEEEKVEKKTGPFSFSVIGDSERYKSPNGYKETITKTWKKASNMNDDLVFFTGDIMFAFSDSGGIDETRRRIQHVKDKFDQLFGRDNYHIVLGNHDIECGTPCVDLWQEIFLDKEYENDEVRTTYYSFDYSNTHFVILTSDYPEEKKIDEGQLKWLNDDLQSSNKENTVVFVHVPPVSFFAESVDKCHDMSCSGTSRRELISILQKHSVDLVVSGHEAVFDHKVEGKIDFVLSGNADGGEPNYEGVMSGQNFTNFEVNGENILLKVIDVDRGIVREIQIK